ncbi:unnamed protein product, partial [Brenthis ino]
MAYTYNLPAPLCLEGNLSENWRRFSQSFKIYLEAAGLNEASDTRLIAILLNTVGENALAVYNTFPKLPKDRKLDDVLKQFHLYCNPKTNILHTRHLFYNRTQQIGESFDNFLTDVKAKASQCGFKKECYEEMIRDRLVFGTIDKDSQEKLIKNGDPPLENVIASLRTAEITNSHIKEIQNSCQAHDKIYSVSSSHTNKYTKDKQIKYSKEMYNNTVKTCNKCGYSHNYAQCPAFGKTCAKCQKTNHFAKVCRSSNKNTNKNVSEVHLDSETEDNYFCGALTSTFFIDSLAWYEKINVEGSEVNFKLDSGADVNIIPMNLFQEITKNSSKPLTLNKTSANLESWNGYKTPIEGIIKLKIKTNNIDTEETFCVAGGKQSIPILSRDTCVKLNLIQRMEISEVSKPQLIQNALKHKKYYDLDSKPRTENFTPGQKVYYKDNERSIFWKPATIVKLNINPRSVTIKDDNDGSSKVRNSWFIKSKGSRHPNNLNVCSGVSPSPQISPQRHWARRITHDAVQVCNDRVNNVPSASKRTVRLPSYLNDYVLY